ncbi:MAG: cytochrome c biogenesis CcdA family protein [Alphaproteobacteria bacterium]
MTGFALSFLAGLVTLLNPCVLPLLPVIVGSALSQDRRGPLALAAGLVLSFSVLGLLILTVGFSVGLDDATVRIVAAAILIAAGALLAVPRLHVAFATVAAPFAAGGNVLLGRVSGHGLIGQFAIGGLLGLVWTPCVGPTLGVAIAAASRGERLLDAFITFLAFGVGVAVALLAFAYGSRKALSMRKDRAASIARWGKPVMGVTLIVVGVMILTGIDKVLEAALVDLFPQWLINFTTRY